MEALQDFLRTIDWNPTWWFLNQPIICALLPTAIAAVLAQRVNRVVLQNEASIEAIRATANAQEQLASDESAEPPDASPQVSGEGISPAKTFSEEEQKRLDDGAKLILRLKAFVDKTADGVRDGRRRRKYNNIDRHDYRVLILSLAADGALSAEDASRLTHAFSLWRRFQRRRKPVPDFVLSELRDAVKQFSA